jgi:CheY-like chemotaxis protein/HPt (histidine-containing phosphotransfer) domain-containing protein
MDPGPTPRRILAIDDDPISLAIAAVLLEAEGSIVVQAESGERALEMLADGEPPDCILADLRMPTLSGPELAARLHVAAPAATLVAMSATPPDRVPGYDGCLKKPLSPEALRALLANLGASHHAPPTEGHPGTDSAPSDPELVDTAVFDRLRGAMPVEALEEVIVAFLQDAGQRLEQMRVADPETICRQAHTLKGGASMIGAVQVAFTASVVEAGIDHHGERLRKLDELECSLRQTEVILKQRLKI